MRPSQRANVDSVRITVLRDPRVGSGGKDANIHQEISLSNTIFLVTNDADVRLQRVLAQLRLYEHPLLDFSARAKGDGVELIIQFKNPPVPVHTYYFDLHPRDLDNSQFEWSLQRQLYDCLHDYLVEMFIRTPQDRLERQREGL
jgi:hypothetical protein